MDVALTPRARSSVRLTAGRSLRRGLFFHKSLQSRGVVILNAANDLNSFKRQDYSHRSE
jgi:hypothetical protein